MRKSVPNEQIQMFSKSLICDYLRDNLRPEMIQADLDLIKLENLGGEITAIPVINISIENIAFGSLSEYEKEKKAHELG